MVGVYGARAEQLTVEVTRTDGRRELTLTGELDGAEVRALAPLLDSVTPGESVVVDTSGLTFVDSLGIRLLVDWHERVNAAGGSLEIRWPSPPLERILRATQLDSVLDVAWAPGAAG